MKQRNKGILFKPRNKVLQTLYLGILIILPTKCWLPDLVSTSECYYSAISPACWAQSTDIENGGASTKHKQSAPKLSTKSYIQNQ